MHSSPRCLQPGPLLSLTSVRCFIRNVQHLQSPFTLQLLEGDVAVVLATNTEACGWVAIQPEPDLRTVACDVWVTAFDRSCLQTGPIRVFGIGTVLAAIIARIVIFNLGLMHPDLRV